MRKTQKETIEYDSNFLSQWNQFCDHKGYIKRQASHACRIAFMQLLTAEQREFCMQEAQKFVARDRETPPGELADTNHQPLDVDADSQE